MAALCALLFCSGAVALGYEVLWARDFVLSYGGTAVGTAVVLAAYFTGISLGASVGGQLALTSSRPLRLYAVFEGALALAVLAYGFFRPTIPRLAVALAHSLPAATLPAAQAALAFATLIMPAAMIGASFPAAAATLKPGNSAGAAQLYAWNTLGGAAGAIVFGLVLLGTLGTLSTFIVGVALNLTIASGALLLAKRPSSAPLSAPPCHPSGRLLAVAMTSGFAGLAAEVMWTRGLSGVLSNSVYSVAIVLAAVLIGLVAGATIAARLSARRADWAIIAPTATLAALAMLASVFVLHWLGRLSLLLVTGLRVEGAAAGLLVEAVLAMVVVFVPAALLGMLLPLTFGVEGVFSLGGLTGRVLAANAIGGIGGALTAAFVLLPIAGLRGGTAAIALTLGLLAVGCARSRQTRIPAGLAVAAAIATLIVPLRVQVPWRTEESEKVLFYYDGPSATVSVTADARGRRRLRINGQYSLGGTPGLFLESRMAHLPILLHPAAQRMLVLGVGTGDTIGAATVHPGLHVDGVELLPEVLQAVTFFSRENRDVLRNSRARFIDDDARSYLLTSEDTYDLIVSDLFLPWQAGTATLYSTDFYRLGRMHLAPNGAYCQWLPLHQLRPDDLASIVSSFTDAFPHVQLWVAYHRSLTPLAALIGSSNPLVVDAAAILQRSRVTEAAQAVRAVGLDEPLDVAVLYVGGDRELRIAAAGVAPITHDRPGLEFSAPAAYFHQNGLALATLEWILGRLDPGLGPIREAHATGALRGQLLHAQLALLAGDRPAELNAYLAALAQAPQVRAVRLALVAIARERLLAQDANAAKIIRLALEDLAPGTAETLSLATGTSQ